MLVGAVKTHSTATGAIYSIIDSITNATLSNNRIHSHSFSQHSEAEQLQLCSQTVAADCQVSAFLKE